MTLPFSSRRLKGYSSKGVEMHQIIAYVLFFLAFLSLIATAFLARRLFKATKLPSDKDI